MVRGHSRALEPRYRPQIPPLGPGDPVNHSPLKPALVTTPYAHTMTGGGALYLTRMVRNTPVTRLNRCLAGSPGVVNRATACDALRNLREP